MPEWRNYDPSTFGWVHGNTWAIEHFAFDGHVFPGGVAVGTGKYWTAALDRLVSQPGFSLPPSRDLDAGMWGYEDRMIGGTGRWSFHAYGLALDICAPWNPSGADPPAPGPHRLPTTTGQLVQPLGMEWGGEWANGRDWMHLELHLSRADVDARVGLPTGPVDPGSGGGGSTPFPLPDHWYYGPYEGPTESVSGSGRNDAQYRPGLRLAQTRLGVLDDGYYGPVTAAATRQWQLVHGLEADGLIGVLTWSAMNL